LVDDEEALWDDINSSKLMLQHVVCNTNKGLACKLCGKRVGINFETEYNSLRNTKYRGVNRVKFREEMMTSPHSYEYVARMRRAIHKWVNIHKCDPKDKLVWKLRWINEKQNM